MFHVILTNKSPTAHTEFTHWLLQWKHTVFSVRQEVNVYIVYTEESFILQTADSHKIS
jgi:hypothetical protein